MPDKTIEHRETSFPAGMPLLRELPPVTRGDYTVAVVTLMRLAESHEPALPNLAAACVLVSAYNSSVAMVDVELLRVLDDEPFVAALTVLQACVQLRLGPHQVIDNGLDRLEWVRRRYCEDEEGGDA